MLSFAGAIITSALAFRQRLCRAFAPLAGRNVLPWFIAALLLVLLRCVPFIVFEQIHFDSDQAVVGLMAKHLVEGRTFPIFFYGQAYMLGVQAWLAAPLFAIGGPTIAMLRLPLLIVNVIVAVWLMARLVSRGVGAGMAFLATLPFLAPSTLVSQLLMEALGASVEPFLVPLRNREDPRVHCFRLFLGRHSGNQPTIIQELASLDSMILCEACRHGDPSVEPLIVLLIERNRKGNELSGCFDLVIWQGFGLMGHVVESPRFDTVKLLPGSSGRKGFYHPGHRCAAQPLGRSASLGIDFVGFKATDLHDLGKNPRHLQGL